MISQLNRFITSGSGLEKTLRLCQAVAQIAAVFTVHSTAVRLTTAKLQLALTRRFFRFFGFIESFQRVSARLSMEGMGSVSGWLELAKWTCFGLYFILEDLTILHAMGVYLVPWEARVMREANTFWFYALFFSILGSVYGLLFTSDERSPKAEDQKKKSGQKSQKEKAATIAEPEVPHSSTLVRQIIVDSCDMLIPAELLNWFPTGDLVLGVTMVMSTLLTGHAIWKRKDDTEVRAPKKISMEPKKMDSRGIEPRTTPMLRGYYTTKPQAQFDGRRLRF
ncbi:hypothetical protein N7462_011039 [Penicillium macrosclerotiorum]|uniref:uncharacterized protein n=1 Tax=Penicillium macrosclerotiorum TaxID=303699 RepID=UPI00254865EA|nr:uncharacterized protein N7462_011039 [Penicillium macrosclerotiorum]KAJ5666630.1 hypothetical protein N7462_011039 [Penicillium macrosclerotiorum]